MLPQHQEGGASLSIPPPCYLPPSMYAEPDGQQECMTQFHAVFATTKKD